MKKAQNNFYDILEIDVSASAADIQAAYERLLQHLTSSDHGLPHRQSAERINLLNQAYWTLSDQQRRANYDATLDSPGDEIQFAVEIRETHWTPQKILLVVIGGLIALSLAMQIAFNLYAYYRAKKIMENQASYSIEHNQNRIAEERALAEERREQAELNRLAAEERRLEFERQESLRRQEHELEANRRYADQVARELHYAEERARREEETERRRAEQEERMKQEAERRRIEQQKYLWQQQLRSRQY